MILRFSLYGFLKNQRYFEAFLLLALLERGLDFFAIGALVSVREVTVNALEIPSGALADALGRRRCMVASMLAYVVAYAILGLGGTWWVLAVGMLGHGVGDAFRSGTHKALIQAWLRVHGREDEQTRVYGYTRSWSKIGSAVSALGAGALVAAGADYRWLFLASAVPSALNVVNLGTYPAELDGPAEARGERGARGATTRTWSNVAHAVKDVLRAGRLRGLVLGSAAIQGADKVSKDYLQPVLQALALGLPLAAGLDGQQRTGVVVGVVSAGLFLLASLASRYAHALERRAGGPDAAVRAIVVGLAAAYALLVGCVLLGRPAAAAVGFVALSVGQNLWRPIQVGRIGREAGGERLATVLSIDSQARTASAALLAPLIGFLVDLAAAGAEPTPLRALWPLGLLGLPLAALAVAPTRRGSRRSRPAPRAS